MPRKKSQDKPQRFFIVNKGGAVQEVTREDAERLLNKGCSLASQEQAKAYMANAIQRYDKPIAELFPEEPPEEGQEDQEEG